MPSLRSGRPVLIGGVGLLAAAYAVVLFIFYSAQERLIFVGHQLQGTRTCLVPVPAGLTEVTLGTFDGRSITGYFGGALTPGGEPAPDAATRPALIFLYGNGDCAGHTLDHVRELRRLGLNVVVPDYPGYGTSPGGPSERGCRAAADAAYDFAAARPDVDKSRIVPMGVSMGGAVAVGLSVRRPVRGLVVSSSFTSMADMAHLQYPWLAISLILKHPFDSEKAIAGVTCPILLTHGDADTLIPPSMTARLAAAARAPVTRIVIAGTGHDDIFAEGKLVRSVGAFVNGLP